MLESAISIQSKSDKAASISHSPLQYLLKFVLEDETLTLKIVQNDLLGIMVMPKHFERILYHLRVNIDSAEVNDHIAFPQTQAHKECHKLFEQPFDRPCGDA